MIIDSAGNLIKWGDMCPYCSMDTGGNHELGCPNAPQWPLWIKPLIWEDTDKAVK